MNRNLWAVTVISLTALCWATAFFGAGATGVVASLDATESRFNQIEPEYSFNTNLFILQGERAAMASPDDDI